MSSWGIPLSLLAINSGPAWVYVVLVAIFVIIIVGIAAWSGAAEVRIEVRSFKVVIAWPGRKRRRP
jgi:hypothetical protein